MVKNADAPYSDLIYGTPGKLSICKNSCAKYGDCDYGAHLPRVHPMVSLVIEYMQEIKNGFKEYYWKGNIRHQAGWFGEMIAAGNNEINIIQRQKNGKS